MQEVLVELNRQNQAKQDFISPAQGMRLREDGHTFEINHLTTSQQEVFGTTSLFHRQVASALGISAKYYDLMQAQKPELLAENVNSWFADKPSSYMVRSMDYGAGQVARALLSERYRRIDNMEIATSVLPLFAGNDQYEVMSCEVTENRLYLKVVNHRLEMEVRKGDIVQAGVMISNSEVGLGAVSIQPLVGPCHHTGGHRLAGRHDGATAVEADQSVRWRLWKMSFTGSQNTKRKTLRTGKSATATRTRQPMKPSAMWFGKSAGRSNAQENARKGNIRKRNAHASVSGGQRRRSRMRENEVEKQFVEAVRAAGGQALKFTSQSMNGVPDRLVLLLGGKCAFVELKAPGKQMRILQRKRRLQLEELGFPVFCVDRPEQIQPAVDALLHWTPSEPIPQGIGAKILEMPEVTLPQGDKPPNRGPGRAVTGYAGNQFAECGGVSVGCDRGVCRISVCDGERLAPEVHCRRWRDILQSKGKERDAGNRDESVPSGKNDSGVRGLRERPQKAGNFWRELSVPSISSDWRVLKKI